jgi:hypothetical protein
MIIRMNRFSLQLPSTNKYISPHKNKMQSYFNKDMNYLICSYGGSGSTVLFNYMSNFGKVYHVHDRYPPNKLSYIGNENTTEDVYAEWFNNVEIPQAKLANYKVIFIYRHPIPVIFSRFAQAKGPNIPHLQHIKCLNNGNINLYDVLNTSKDLYGMEEFYNNYTCQSNRNYDIYAVKYELFWDNISLFNKIIGIPDVNSLYPIRQEKPKRLHFMKELTFIYNSLINKMNSMRFMEIIRRVVEKDEHCNDEN